MPRWCCWTAIPLTEPGGYYDFVHLSSAGLDRMEVVRGPESALFGAEASSAVIQIFTHQGDAESTRPHGSLVYERGSFSTDHWAASLDGGLAQKIDYAFTADQFRTTGEFPERRLSNHVRNGEPGVRIHGCNPAAGRVSYV